MSEGNKITVILSEKGIMEILKNIIYTSIITDPSSFTNIKLIDKAIDTLMNTSKHDCIMVIPNGMSKATSIAEVRISRLYQQIGRDYGSNSKLNDAETPLIALGLLVLSQMVINGESGRILEFNSYAYIFQNRTRIMYDIPLEKIHRVPLANAVRCGLDAIGGTPYGERVSFRHGQTSTKHANIKSAVKKVMAQFVQYIAQSVSMKSDVSPAIVEALKYSKAKRYNYYIPEVINQVCDKHVEIAKVFDSISDDRFSDHFDDIIDLETAYLTVVKVKSEKDDEIKTRFKWVSSQDNTRLGVTLINDQEAIRSPKLNLLTNDTAYDSRTLELALEGSKVLAEFINNAAMSEYDDDSIIISHVKANKHASLGYDHDVAEKSVKDDITIMNTSDPTGNALSEIKE